MSGAVKMRSATTKAERPKATLVREERLQADQQKAAPPLSKEELEAENAERQTRIKLLEDTHVLLK